MASVAAVQGTCEVGERVEVLLPQAYPGVDVMQERGPAMAGGHVGLVQLALFVVHPGERAAVRVVHQRAGLPEDSVRAFLEQDVAEVDEGKFWKAEDRGDPPVGVVHPCGCPAQPEAEPEQGSSVSRVEPDLPGASPG